MAEIGTLKGAVYDKKGNTVENAEILVLYGNVHVAGTISQNDGLYLLNHLTPATYTVTAKALTSDASASMTATVYADQITLLDIILE